MRSFLPFFSLVVAAACSGGRATSTDGGPDSVAREAAVGQDATADAPGANDVGTTSPDATAPMDGPTTPDGALVADTTVDAPSMQDVWTPPDSGPMPDAAIMNPCQLPGSVQFTSGGAVTVPGGSPTWPSLAFLHLPTGFCAHYFATVGNARQIRFAPGGEAFVASPTQGTTGGGPGGLSAIVVLPDDNLDGVADGTVLFLGGMIATQGILFTGGYLYYQDGTASTVIRRMPYAPGQRAPSGTSEVVANITVYTSGIHWPKTMDVADDGTIYVGNGGDQGEACNPSHPFHGGILKIDPSNPNGTQVAKGLRNPINVRCRRGNNTCFALELARDFSTSMGGREKLLPIHAGDDWGFPCCATQNLPYSDSPAGTDCSGVAAEGNAFLIGDTPFGVDFEPGAWPAPFTGNAFVVTHGTAGGWMGARMVAIPMDASTGLPLPSSNPGGQDMGMVDFGTGWDDGTLLHGRPAAVSFSPDGRLFVTNDYNGVIFWIAPMAP
jgi:glucose/arabinose dehydrogenase